METRSISSSPDVVVANTAPRVTPTPPRATKFGEVLQSTVVQSAESAMRTLPGSPMMAVALRSASGSGTMGVPMSTMSSPQGPIATTRITDPVGAPAVGSAVGSTGEGGAGMDASLQQSQDLNLYYLQLQEAMSAQNREYTAISNVLKAKHDTVKTAIGNIR